MAELPNDATPPSTDAATNNKMTVVPAAGDLGLGQSPGVQYCERVGEICNMHDVGWLATENELSAEAMQAVALLSRDSGKSVSQVTADVYEAAPGIDEQNIADDEDKYGNLDEYGDPLPPLGDLNRGSGDDDDWDDSAAV
ncbi:hypothetical protein P0D73_15830 [Paraburkholderia sp. RL18-101-BIB-B]|uniref:hypothetical protein n=1 Tax=Paraburkholderia sp. RL18-101-BIB-B TaxID=3031634 RepID=UPI0038B832E4